MSKWKCEICNKEFENFHAQGFDNKIHCPICFFKEKSNRLEQQLDTYKKVFDEIRWHIEELKMIGCERMTFKPVEEILDKVNKLSRGD